MNNNSVFIEKLRFVGLRPTKQRIKICEELFNRKETFHFTINELKELLQKKKIKEFHRPQFIILSMPLKKKAI